MAELTTTARPYARAAFELALADGQLAPWAEALNVLAAIVADSKIAGLIKSPTLSADEKRQLLATIAGDSLGAKQLNFIQALADNKRLGVLPEINSLFLALKAAQEKTLEVEVVSAFALDDVWQAKLTAALSEKLQRSVKISTQLDKSLLGGALIRAGDTVIDGSVKGRLAKLADAITS